MKLFQLRAWRNGKRGNLKSFWPLGFVGSSPTVRTDSDDATRNRRCNSSQGQAFYHCSRRSDVKFIYVRNTKGAPIGCVAYRVSDDYPIVEYGLSTQHPNDRFSKALARNIAVARLNKSANRVETGTPKLPAEARSAAANHVFTALVADKSTPGRVRKAAVRWLSTPRKAGVDNFEQEASNHGP